MHAKVQAPAVPEDLAAADAEARAVRLRHDERPERTAWRSRSDTLFSPGTAAERRFEHLLHRTTGEIDADGEPANFRAIADWIPDERRDDERNGGPAARQPRSPAHEEVDSLQILDALSRQRLHHTAIAE